MNELSIDIHGKKLLIDRACPNGVVLTVEDKPTWDGRVYAVMFLSHDGSFSSAYECPLRNDRKPPYTVDGILGWYRSVFLPCNLRRDTQVIVEPRAMQIIQGECDGYKLTHDDSPYGILKVASDGEVSVERHFESPRGALAEIEHALQALADHWAAIEGHALRESFHSMMRQLHARSDLAHVAVTHAFWAVTVHLRLDHPKFLPLLGSFARLYLETLESKTADAPRGMEVI